VSIDEVVQRLPGLVLEWTQGNATALFIPIALVVGYIIGRFRASRASPYQNRAEALLSHVVRKKLGFPDYHLMNHVTLQLKDGTTQIDHILVSRFGVFVIETKDYKGWIFADAKQAKWTQVLFNLKFRFQNPIFQNSRHVRAVQGCLDFLPPDVIKSVIVFTGRAEFKTAVPQGVFWGFSALMDYLRRQNVEVMSLNRMQFWVGSRRRASPSAARRTSNTSRASSVGTAG
jgi:hypothetical protein